MHSTDNTGLLISLVSLPYTEGNSEFFENEFKKGIYERYSARLNDFACSPSSTKISDKYYKPKSYYIYGDYDIAILSLIDDFSFGSRKFHPSSSYIHEDSQMGMNFNYQIITGFLSKNINSTYNLEYLGAKSFLLEENPYPFISITKLKINNGLLVGNGQEFLSLIRAFINKTINLHEDNTTFILLDTFCNNELTLLIFSRDHKTIIESILHIREADLQYAYSTIIENLNKDSKSYKNIIQSYPKIKENCLYQHLMSNKKIDDCEIDGLHIFANTHTILGYDIELFGKEDNISFELPNDLQFDFEWDIKPGHLSNVVDLIEPSEDKSNLFVSIGHGVLTNSNNLDHSSSLPNVFDMLYKKNDNLLSHLRKFKSFPKFKYDSIPNRVPQNNIKDKHSSLNHYLTKNLTFNSKQVRSINDTLRKLNISKALRERVLKMYGNYNNCIKDNSLFIYFVELKEFLNYFEETIKKWPQNLAAINTSRHSWIEYVVESFEKAYQNRFYQSNRTMDFADYNLEYNGGAQQLISSLDACYKAIIKPLSSSKVKSFLVISSYERVTSKRDIVKLNYFHLFQPELFISIITKEAANFHINRHDFDIQGNSLENKDLLESYFSGFTDSSYSSQIIKELNNKLYNTSITNESVIELYLNGFDKILNYLYTDMITFYLGYNRDYELFYFWYWSSILQSSKSYSKNGELKDEIFLSSLLRVMLLGKLYQQKNETINQISFSPPSFVLNNLWDKYFSDVNHFCTTLFEIKEFEKWGKIAFLSINEILRRNFMKESLLNIQEDISMRELDRDKYGSLFSKVENSANVVDLFQKKTVNFNDGKEIDTQVENANTMLNQINRYFKNESAYFIRELRKGNIIEFDKSFVETDSAYVIKLFISYLIIIKELSNNKISLLERTENGAPDDDYLKGVSQDTVFFVDKHGGLFVNSHLKRKEYFKIRTAFFKSIWDFCLKSKLDFFP